ncbi:MAG: DUF3179 domain-containing protein [Bacteroidia bacterium]|nr:DUF3179 domain-containing protein [Bacteroidia bacterium]
MSRSHLDGSDLFLALSGDRSRSSQDVILEEIEENWQPGYEIMALESIYLLRDYRLSSQLWALLNKKTGKVYGADFDKWYDYLWNRDQHITASYADFKALLYKRIDPKFEQYFAGRQKTALIRLDEVRWGGVRQDGIPPLRGPEMISAEEADYLEDDHIVFGIELNGDVRAYPKRILAWHEMFVDEVGGVPVAGVYCTLCGTVILYNTEHDGVKHELGTSGFLYRSNKLMYDKATQSLWNTLQGAPVIGPLAGKGIELEFMSVVTTSWGEWKSRHPQTKVLSLNTGHRRDYGEGVAYQQYFSTDELMFSTPFKDRRLKNKQEVLALRFGEEQLAISTKFLKKRPIYTDKIGEQEVLVLTDRSGGNRVYDPKGLLFTSYDGGSALVDEKGVKWKLEESQLIAEDGQKLDRLPYHRAFWFGWLAAFPETRLVK